MAKDDLALARERPGLDREDLRRLRQWPHDQPELRFEASLLGQAAGQSLQFTPEGRARTQG